MSVYVCIKTNEILLLQFLAVVSEKNQPTEHSRRELLTFCLCFITRGVKLKQNLFYSFFAVAKPAPLIKKFIFLFTSPARWRMRGVGIDYAKQQSDAGISLRGDSTWDLDIYHAHCPGTRTYQRGGGFDN
uniref:(northern house mosquito) hypothetical protein n=1 Tax=Culex pipiens TaxID=7175 RepID=A0A8D8B9X4_CULPI